MSGYPGHPSPARQALSSVLPAETEEMCIRDRWWTVLQQRYVHDDILFSPVVLDRAARLPAALFDSVADNLLHNALLKRQGESNLEVRFTLAADAASFTVCDSGSVVRKEITNDLLRAPVRSENGLGIGLYHAARQAEGYGYELRLAGNVAGQVCFELSNRRR